MADSLPQSKPFNQDVRFITLVKQSGKSDFTVQLFNAILINMIKSNRTCSLELNQGLSKASQFEVRDCGPTPLHAHSQDKVHILSCTFFSKIIMLNC